MSPTTVVVVEAGRGSTRGLGHCYTPPCTCRWRARARASCNLEYFHDPVRLEPMLFDGVPQPRRLRPDLPRPGLDLELKRQRSERQP